METVKTQQCPSCGKNNLIETYESFECMSCAHLIFKRQSYSKVLEGNEIAKIIMETIHEHGIVDPMEIQAIEEAFLSENSASMISYKDIFEHTPVDMDEMFSSDRYLGKITESLYPKLKEDLILLFENPTITTVVLKGSLGWGKTYYLGIALIAITMQLCFLRSPQTFYNLDENTPLSLFNFCVTDSQARKTLFTYLLNFFDAVPWFKQYAPRNEDKSLEIDIKSKNIVLRCGGPNPGSVIGTNLHSFAGDEMNFMNVIKDSKRARDGEEYDEAKIVTDVFTNRQTSRFTQHFIYCPPRRFLSSSEQFPDDFLPTFVKEQEANYKVVTRDELIHKDFDPKLKNTYVMSYSNWETKPQEFFPGWTFERDDEGKFIKDEDGNRIWKMFRVGTGHNKKGDRLLLENESEKGYKNIIKVPIFFREKFEGGIGKLYGSIRDIAGEATLYNNPWFNPTHLMQCIDPNREHPVNYENPSLEERDFHLDVTKMMVGGKFINPDSPRYVHLDLSKTDDHTGICIVHISKIVPIMKKIAGELVLEHLPFFHVDLMLRVKPPGNGKSIDYAKIRNILYLLRRKGMHYNLITYDKVEGEMGTHFEKNDINHDYLSLDKNIQPWFHLEMALRENRVGFYDYEPIKEELPFLFYDEKKKKIDHRKNKRKDMSDAFAGAIWNASQSKNLRLSGEMLVELMAFEQSVPNVTDPFKEAGVDNFYGKGMAYVEQD